MRLLFAVVLASLWATAHAQTIISPGKSLGPFDLTVNQTTPGPSQFALSTRAGFGGLIVEADTSVGAGGVRLEMSCDEVHWTQVGPTGVVCVDIPTGCLTPQRVSQREPDPMCVYRLFVLDPCGASGCNITARAYLKPLEFNSRVK
jgi:hypothetical protein